MFFNFKTSALFMIIIAFLSLNLFFPPAAASDKTGKGRDFQVRSGPEAIDPLEKGIYDFLDTDLEPFENRAAQAYKAGRFREAAQCYLYLLGFDYADARAMFNLACCYGKMGEARSAADMLRKAVHTGFTDIDRITTHQAFRNLNDDPVFADFLNHLKDYGTHLGETIYIPGPKLFACRVHLPHRYKKSKRYPLVIGLHGHGSNAENMASLSKYMGKTDFIYASPDGPYPFRMRYRTRGKMRSWDIGIKDEKLWATADPLSVEYIRQAALHLSGLYPIDSIYLMGHSQGAAYAYITGIKNPELFRGIICFGGRIPPIGASYSQLKPADLEAANRLRVFISHGNKDPLLNIRHARQSKALLEQYGYKPEYLEFEGGHEISPRALKQAAAWLSEQPEATPGK